MTANLPVAAQESPLALLMDEARFNHLQRVARILAMSPLFPEHLRKSGLETAIANGVLVLNMAHRLREDPLAVAQAIYFVGGRPGWSASYLIAKANQHGVFREGIDWEVKGKGDDLEVTAYANLSSTGKRVEVTLGMKTAKAEGWAKNPKYQTIPEQMLRYRTATFLIRLYCPEITIGVPSTIELEAGGLDEMIDVTPPPAANERMQPAAAPMAGRRRGTATAADDAAPAEDKKPEQAAEPPAADDEPTSPADDERPDDGHIEALVEMMIREVEAVETRSDVNDVLIFYADQIADVARWLPAQHTRLIARIAELYEAKAA